MAKCTMGQDLTVMVSFDKEEWETIGMHGKRETLSLVDALADLVEYAIGQKRCEICQEEHDAVECQSEEARTVGIDLRYPKKGPLALLSEAEREYLYSHIMAALGEGVTSILIRHSSGGN